MDISSFINDFTKIPLVIAEIGINHNGSVKNAREMIHEAAKSNVHAIKFQYRNLENAYAYSSHEIGDDIVKSEITRNFISPNHILELAEEAKRLKLWAGCSFFDTEDCEDFGSSINYFDFFKIPSVELLNFPLTAYLSSQGKPLLLSTGAHWEHEIEASLSRMKGDDWYPLHCISNYPVAYHNSNLEYISHLRNRWQVPVGYSSHESQWEFILLALQHNPRIIERHITLSRRTQGLDQSSSSEPHEFARLMSILKDVRTASRVSHISRVPNHGEVINRQNLGRSLYFTKKQLRGDDIDTKSMLYRAPAVGLNWFELDNIVSRRLIRNGEPLTPLALSHFKEDMKLSALDFERANSLEISIPVRLHDFHRFKSKFPLKCLELHLSYSEVENLSQITGEISDISLSVHLPDYVDPLNLIDPMSHQEVIAEKSIRIINTVSNFVEIIQDRIGERVFVVGSFPKLNGRPKSVYYDQYSDLLEKLKLRDIEVCMQWLPPFAWYFGGSERIDIMNQDDDIRYLLDRAISICLDTSHLILGSNYFGFEIQDFLARLAPITKHLHVADAQSFDGEGSHIDLNSLEKVEFFKKVLSFSHKKVIEVWQGHLNDGAGFSKAIRDLLGIDLANQHD